MLQHKTAFITGGSKGIGFGIAVALIKEGINVAITGRNEKDLFSAVNQLNDHSSSKAKAIGQVMDVKAFSEQQKAIESTVTELGNIDIIIANAGFWKSASIDELSVELWDETIATNLSGMFYTLKAGLEQLKTTKGYFFTLSSLMGNNFHKNCSAHVASKFGVTGFTQAAMLDLRVYGIKTSMLMPGSVATHYDENTPEEDYNWKIQPSDIGQIIVDLLKMERHVLPSKVEVRPAFPRKK